MNVACDRTHTVQLRVCLFLLCSYVERVPKKETLVLGLNVAMTKMPSYHPSTMHQARQTSKATT